MNTVQFWVGLSGVVLSWPATASPDALRLQMPLACPAAVSCPVQNHFDQDPGEDFRDYNCGRLSYDGHDGTDIRLPNLGVMREGVAVVAAAAGRVRAVRDGMPDVSVRERGRDAVKNVEAGNAVVLQHGDDWETQYSHLRRGSVRVRAGQQVAAGEPLGLVGLSGNTEFPHLHFEVRFRGRPVDPFVGVHRARACGVGEHALWEPEALQALAYRATGLLQAGYATGVPSAGAVAAGEAVHGPLATDAPALVFWVEVFGAHEGDVESLVIYGPDGSEIVSKRKTVAGHKARWFSYAGRKRRGSAWPAGRYQAVYRLTRDAGGSAEPVIEIERTMLLR